MRPSPNFKQTLFAQLLPPKKIFVHFPKVTWLWMWTRCNISGERGQDGGDDDDDGDDDGDDDDDDDDDGGGDDGGDDWTRCNISGERGH